MSTRISSSPIAPAAPARPSGVETFVRAPVPADRFLGAVARRSSSAVPPLSTRFSLGNIAGEGFEVQLGGHYPPVAAGSFLTKLKQGSLTTENAAMAEESILTHGHCPSDAFIQHRLAGLKVNAIDPKSPVSVANYRSTIPNASPADAYALFVSHPGAVFGAGGLTVRPAVSKLEEGQRLMLQHGGVPPVWFPIEVHLDPASNTIHIATLDGHPFRGFNDFQFESDGQGGTRIVQNSSFQGSSDLIHAMGQGQFEEQHQTWRGVHDFLYQHLANSTPAANAAA